MKYEESKRWFGSLCRGLAQNAWLRYKREGLTPLYVVGDKVDGIWQNVRIETQEGSGMPIVGTHLPRNYTVDQLTATITDWLKCEPLIPS